MRSRFEAKDAHEFDLTGADRVHIGVVDRDRAVCGQGLSRRRECKQQKRRRRAASQNVMDDL